MSHFIELRGITWNHSRAYPPLVATAQRFEELNPGVRIRWERRTLDEFGHARLGPLAEHFDLLVIDHPMLGTVSRDSLLAPLDQHLAPASLDALSREFVGASFDSYLYDEHLWALPIDAAAPAASYRPDLLERPPRTWPEVIELAREGQVVMPGFAADVFLNFMGVCVTFGSEFGEDCSELFEFDLGLRALDLLSELAAFLPSAVWDWNPIALYEAMASGGPFVYCPFAYTYSNYARAGFAKHRLRFTDPPVVEGQAPVRTILGGTGLGISRSCSSLEVALQYSQAVAGQDWQTNIYALAGGQPARRHAWTDPTLDAIAGGFFEDTLPSIERAAIRPRYAGYTEFQVIAGEPLVEYLRHGGSPRRTLEKLLGLHCGSRRRGNRV